MQLQSGFGTRQFEYFRLNPDAARLFDEAMTGLSTSEVGAILADYDFSKRKKISVIEMVFPPGNEPSFGQLVDLEMMLIGGVERAETEYRTLLAETGFNPTRVIPTSSPVCIVESVLA